MECFCHMTTDEYLDAIEKDFDAEVGLYGLIAGPGYHLSRIPAATRVHQTRENLNHAASLLKSARPDRVERGRKIIEIVIGAQGLDPAGDLYGTWAVNMEAYAAGITHT